MENKISIGALATAMSTSSGKSKKFCEDFVREFFKLVAETLGDGEIVKVKGFGTFKLVDVESRNGINVNTGRSHKIESHKKVVFTPAKELAAAINAPFEEFESVEIDEDLRDLLFMEDDSVARIEESVHEEGIDDCIAEEGNDGENNIDKSILEEGSREEAEDDDITLEAYASLNKVNDASVPVLTHETEFEVEPVKSRFGIGVLTGALCTFTVCVVVFMLGCFFDWWPVNFGDVREVVAENRAEMSFEETTPVSEEIEEPQPAPAPEPDPVYDTVSTTRYLTTIAREHYGNYNLWPYIYIENSSILGHPDRITPGTRIVVPPLSKYGVDPTNKEDIAEAKRKGAEIYARFK